MLTVLGLLDYSEIEIQSIIQSHIKQLKNELHFEGLDFDIQGIELFGSRIFGKPRNKSDLDVKIKYTGTAHEDDLLNALNDKHKRLFIKNILVDFHTVKLEI
jgi:predicted nucleotidyltransferase